MDENINIYRTVEAWAEITKREWQAKLNALDIGVTGSLYDSINYTVKPADKIPGVIEFNFNHYGVFVEHGVGKGISKGNSGDLGFTPIRKPKRWFTPVIRKEAGKLTKILAEKYAIMCNGIIASNIMETSEHKAKKQSIRAKSSRPGDWGNDSAPDNAARPLSDLDLYWMKKNGLI